MTATGPLERQSVKAKANALEGRALAYATDAKAQDERTRTSNELVLIQRAVLEVASVLRTVDALRASGATIEDPRRFVDEGLVNLKGHAESRLPSSRALQNARKKLDSHRARIDAELKPAWSTWSSAELKSVPTSSIPLLPWPQQDPTRQRFQTAKELAKKSSPTPSDVSNFKMAVSACIDELAGIDSHSDLAKLLQRIDSLDITTLADLSFDELKLLYGDETVAGQIEVRRK